MGLPHRLRITLMHEAQSGSDLPRQPALMDQFAADPIVQRAALNQFGARPAHKPQHVTNRARHQRAIAGLTKPPPRQFPPDRAWRAAQHQTYLAKAAATPMPGQNTPLSSLPGCLYRLSIATSYALLAGGVALET